MIEKQREKEFLFDLELLYYKYNLVISSHCYWLADLGNIDIDNMTGTTRRIESAIDDLRT